MANNKDYRGGCLLLTIAALGFICQVVFLTLKLCGAVAWHWAIVLIPLMVIFGLPILFVFLYVLLVIDFFAGSGSTLIACETAGRTCYASELDEHYADVIVQRYVKIAGGVQCSA